MVLLRDLGAAMSPFNAFLSLQGVETLALRMERHCANAAAVAAWLGARTEVVKVIHPSVQTGVGARAREQIPRRAATAGSSASNSRAAARRAGASSTR